MRPAHSPKHKALSRNARSDDQAGVSVSTDCCYVELTDFDQREHIDIGGFGNHFARLEERKLHQKAHTRQTSAELLDEMHLGDSGTAGCHEVVDQQHDIVGTDSVGVDFKSIGAA